MSLFGVDGGVDGAGEAGREDGVIGAFVETVVAEWVDKDVGVCAGETPEVVEVARFLTGCLRRFIGNQYIVLREVAVEKGSVPRVSYSILVGTTGSDWHLW